jgi:hypothetical protein
MTSRPADNLPCSRGRIGTLAEKAIDTERIRQLEVS